jgi:tryptophan 2-monooxygenase
METDPGPADLPPDETGAVKFPVEARLFWHYVRTWARFRCQGTPQDPDLITAAPFPNPGTVPTQVCYQNEWFNLDPDLKDLPPAVLEVARLWRSFLANLNNGYGEDLTTYLPEVQKLTRAADPSQASRVIIFWKAMRKRYEHKSLGEVLQTEVFVSRDSEVPNLMKVFGTFGVGTGGFGSLFEIGFLEVLRNVIWNTSGDYSLPDKTEYDQLDRGTAGLVDGLAHLAHETASRTYTRPFTDMFRTKAEVTGITVNEGFNKVVVSVSGNTIPFDYAIVAMSTRAMQAIGLDRDTPGGPFNVTSQVHTKDSLAAVQSVQAAIHQLNMVSAFKMIVTVDDDEPGWPTNAEGRRVTCFLTDRYPSVTTFMPAVGLSTRTRAVVAALGNDALKFQSKYPDERQQSSAAAFYSPDATHVWPQAVVGAVLSAAHRDTLMDWNRRPYVGGGFKLDRPGDSYLSGSLFYHCQLATEDEIRPYSRVFLAGDSVGFMGGWAEGSAMSALNATTAVLTQVAKQAQTKWVVRSAELIAKKAPFHEWRLMGTTTDKLPRLKGMTRVVDCSKDPNKPGSWRYDRGDDCTLVQVAVSHDGRQMLGANADGTVYHRRFRRLQGWSVLAPLPQQVQGVQDIAISTGASSDQSADGVAQALVVSPPNGALEHRLRREDGSWTDWGFVPDGQGGAIYARRCAIAVEGPASNHAAQVCVITGQDMYLRHLIRWSDGSWTKLGVVPGPKGYMMASEVAMATAYDQESTLVAVVDVNGKVQLTQRDVDGQWTPWQSIELPKGIGGASFTARRISMVGSPDEGRGQLLVQCNDLNLYHRLVDVGRPTYFHKWRRVPYPQGAPYNISDIALGRSVADECDPAQSVAVWTVGDLWAGSPPVRVGDAEPAPGDLAGSDLDDMVLGAAVLRVEGQSG